MSTVGILPCHVIVIVFLWALCTRATSATSGGVSLRGSRTEANAGSANLSHADIKSMSLDMSATADNSSSSATDAMLLDVKADTDSSSLMDANAMLLGGNVHSDNSLMSNTTYRQLKPKFEYQSCAAFVFSEEQEFKTDFQFGHVLWNKAPTSLFQSANFWVKDAEFPATPNNGQRLDVVFKPMENGGHGYTLELRVSWKVLFGIFKGTHNQMCTVLLESTISLQDNGFTVELPEYNFGERKPVPGRKGHRWTFSAKFSGARVLEQGYIVKEVPKRCLLAITTDSAPSIAEVSLANDKYGETSLLCGSSGLCVGKATEYRSLHARSSGGKIFNMCKLPKK